MRCQAAKVLRSSLKHAQFVQYPTMSHSILEIGRMLIQVFYASFLLINF